MKISNLVSIAMLAGMTSFANAEGAAQWEYKGDRGPARWGLISQAYHSCAIGVEQSPVDLAHTIRGEPEDIQFHWNKLADWSEVNNGHTIQLNSVDAGHASLKGKDYKLVQFHFHAPSEHTIDGKSFPMEVHFVHVADDGAIVVVGAMMEDGGQNDFFQSLMEKAPKDANGKVAFGQADPEGLLPATGHYYRYQGSLTTPPCSETVVWTVLKQPIKVSDASIKAFQDIYSGNARMIQKIGRRYIIEK